MPEENATATESSAEEFNDSQDILAGVDEIADSIEQMLMEEAGEGDEDNPEEDVIEEPEGLSDIEDSDDLGLEDEDDEGDDDDAADEDDEADPTEEGENVEDLPAEELAADGKSRPKTEKANDRIRKLVDDKKVAEAAIKDLQEKLAEAERRAATTTEEHPDPEAELEELKQRFRNVKTAEEFVAEGTFPSMAEARAAIAEYKQNLQFQMSELRDVTTARMSQARDSERLLAEQLAPHVEALVTKYPVLDQNKDDYDSNLGDILQAVIDANVIMDRGLVTGFKEDPEKFISKVEKIIVKGDTLQVNNQKKVDKKIDKVASSKKLDSGKSRGKLSDEDLFMKMVDEAQEELGAGF